jgi:LmbE family N-acetylglucosaminyl deacetylase
MAKKNFRGSLASILVVLVLALSLGGALNISRSARAQEPSTTQAANRIELHQALLDLTNPWTVMCIAAHPDDEDGTSLIVMRRKYGAHTVSLFSTFGEGGQNAIGPELYEELGAIRARETMAAAKIQGSEPYFLGLKDFGYSKSADEAFRVWGHEEALRRMVLQIRKLRPDVIITNHSATNNDHGHHQATARLELEAFDAAADPQRFPEQLSDGVSVWQVQRLFVRAGRSNQPQPETAPLVTIDPNELDTIRGRVYAEEALQALQKHATQGPWPKTVAELVSRFSRSTDGKLPLTRYVLVREAKGAESLPKDSHNFVAGLKLPDSVVSELDIPTIDGKPLVEFADDRSKVLEQLLKRTRKPFLFTANFDEPNYLRINQMTERINRATLIAAGVSFHIETAGTTVTRNSMPEFKVQISNEGTQTISVFHCYSNILSLPDRSKDKGGPTSFFKTGPEDLKGGSSLSQTTKFLIPANAPINVPLAAHLYESAALGLQVHTSCGVGFGAGITDGLSLEETANIDVSFPIELTNIGPAPVVITPQTGNVSKSVTLQAVNNGKSRVSTTIETIVVSNRPREAKRSRIPESPLTLAPNDRREVRITLPVKTKLVKTLKTISVNMLPGETSVSPSTAPPAAQTVSLLFRTTDKASNEVVVPIVFADARVAPNLRVGYVRGFDYSLPNALSGLGVESKELTVDEVKTSELQKYSTIIIDNRVYESQPELIAANQKLLDFAKGGGTLIVFYHKSFEWNPDERRNRPQLAPYKLILGDERITDETAPITFIEPEHPLLNFPNKIGQDDFANWIQERGLYYPKDWDPQFHALLQANDPGEAPLKGGLLVADYGRGHYIYTSMVWYRELRAGVPGAYRMFANMISYGHK